MDTGRHPLLYKKKILLGFEDENMAVHATVYNKNIHDEGKATKGPSQRNQRESQCFHHAALSAKQN